MARASQIDASRLLQDTEERPIGISLPLPLSKRLDLLVERTERAGARAYRKDILAALILAAQRRLRSYWTCSAAIGLPRRGMPASPTNRAARSCGITGISPVAGCAAHAEQGNR